MTLVEPVPLVGLDQVRRAHFMAVGGAGMSPIAHMWRQRGIAVSGCDHADGPALQALRDDGVQVFMGHDPAHLAGVDTVVYSSAIRDDNPEMVAARAAGLRVWHRSAALAALMAGHLGVAVSGTHGKSTTSAMLASSLGGIDPSYVLGATLVATGGSHHVGAPGGVFVIEADESDGSYRQYDPQVVVVTNIEADHLDRWGTPEAYAAGFSALAGAPGVRRVVLCADDPGTRALARGLSSPVTFGASPDATVRLTDMAADGLASSATVTWPGGIGRIAIGLPGRHNLLNAAAALAAGLVLGELGVPVGADDVIAGLQAYRGIQRRFQVLGRARGVTVVDDYAHHPTEIAASLAAARGVLGEGHSLAVCFQPHLYTRTRDFADDFGEALSAADLVLVCDVYAAREDPIAGITGEVVAKTARAHGAEVMYTPTLGEAADTLVGLIAGDRARLREGDMVLTLGAGDVTGVGPAVLAGVEGLAHD